MGRVVEGATSVETSSLTERQNDRRALMATPYRALRAPSFYLPYPRQRGGWLEWHRAFGMLLVDLLRGAAEA